MRGTSGTLVAAVWLALVAIARAEDAATFPAGGVAEALRSRVGKPVTLMLASGTQIGGTVAEVRDHAVVLQGIAGRELSDALVALDQVAVVEVRARER